LGVSHSKDASVTLSPVLLFALWNVLALWIHASFSSPETVISLLSCPDRLTVLSLHFLRCLSHSWNQRKFIVGMMKSCIHSVQEKMLQV